MEAKKMNKSSMKFTCKCPFNKHSNQRKCLWTSKGKKLVLSTDPKEFKCEKPNFKLKCNLREKDGFLKM